MTFEPEVESSSLSTNAPIKLPPSKVRIIAVGPGLYDIEVSTSDVNGEITKTEYLSVAASLPSPTSLSCTLESKKLLTTIVSQAPPASVAASHSSAEKLHIFHGGKKITVVIPPPKWLASLGDEVIGAAARKGIRAPMPSVVVEVKVKPGDVVKKGQAVVVLESMKTESVLRSEREGKVISVGCKNGEMVEEGRELVEIGDLD